VLFGPDHGLSVLTLDVCAAAGFTPRGTVQTARVAAAGHLAAAGLGVTVIPGNVVPPGLDAAVLPLDPALMRQLAAYSRQDWSPHAAAFVRALRELPWPALPDPARIIA
jgi:DNA-binding transcriptional LysR family regulator